MEKIALHGPDVFYTGEIGMYATTLVASNLHG